MKRSRQIKSSSRRQVKPALQPERPLRQSSLKQPVSASRSISPGRNCWIILAFILTAGFLLRLSYLGEIVKSPDFSMPMADAAFHDYWARALVSGDWTLPADHPNPNIEQTPYLRPPGYPYFLALIYAVTGGSHYGARLIQMLLGLSCSFLGFLICRNIYGVLEGLLFSAFCATYWGFIYFEGEYLAPVLIIFLSLIHLLAMTRWRRSGTLPPVLFGGLALGLLTLVRPNFLLFIPVACIWIWWNATRHLRIPKPWIHTAALMICTVLVILSATTRNILKSGDPVLISSNGAINLHIGNNELSDGISTNIPEMQELTGLSHWSWFSFGQIVSGLERREGRTMRHSDVSSYFARQALSYIAANPIRFATLSIKRAVLFWGPAEISNNKSPHFEKMNSRTLRWNLTVPFILALSMSGLAALILDHREKHFGCPQAAVTYPDEGARSMLWFTGFFILTYFLSFVPFLVASRFRIPVLPLVFLFGSYGLARCIRVVEHRCWRTLPIYAVLVVFFLIVFSIHFFPYKADRAWWHTDRGTALFRAHRYDEAVSEYQSALKANPGYVDAHVNLATVYVRMGLLGNALTELEGVLAHRPTRLDLRLRRDALLIDLGRSDEAVVDLRDLASAHPQLSQVHAELGRALAETGFDDEAERILRHALSIETRLPVTHLYLGVVTARRGDHLEAIESFRTALSIKPDLKQALIHIGHSLNETGDPEKAAQAYREALSIDPGSINALISLGNLHAERSEYPEAILYYRRAVAVNPSDPAARINLAAIFSNQGQYREAIDELEGALRNDPRNQNVLQRIAAIRSILERNDPESGEE